MARPLKHGLDFFSIDTDISEDPKLEYLEAKYGLDSFGVYIKLLIKIYRAGYFVRWSEKDLILFSSRIQLDRKILNDIIDDIISEDLLNKDLYERYKIFTSSRIQKQYIMAFNRRAEIKIYKEFLLIDPTDEILKNTKIKFINVEVRF